MLAFRFLPNKEKILEDGVTILLSIGFFILASAFVRLVASFAIYRRSNQDKTGAVSVKDQSDQSQSGDGSMIE